jgi:C4-dicarboxylate-specific signal transduction histidine kinase
LGDVEEGLNRVASIVSDLRKFTHPDLSSMDRVDVNTAVNSALRFLSGDWKDRVQFERSLPTGFSVWSNSSLLVHVLVNLLQNSLDALKEKAFDNGEKPTIWIEGRSDADKGLLVVRDNGIGIDPKNMDKVFDPFFTTKDVGQGMGLGLSICYGIIKKSNGRVWVSRTEPGKLCEFTLELPITKPQEAAV